MIDATAHVKDSYIDTIINVVDDVDSYHIFCILALVGYIQKLSTYKGY